MGLKWVERLNRICFISPPEKKRKYLFLKQIATLTSFKERNAISREQYDIGYQGLISKMEITEEELRDWLSEN